LRHFSPGSLAPIQANFGNLPIQVMCGTPQRAKLILKVNLEARQMEHALIGLSNELAELVGKVDPHIVSIRARRHYPSSGVIWNSEVVVTASHTIERDEEISVSLADGTTAEATLVGRDPGADLAVLKVQTNSALEPINQTNETGTGELALVVGRSPDSGVNASLGIISAKSGPWRTWRGGQLDAYIRLDARMFPHSSGGAVVNAQGQILGIATSALSRIAGVAIPASTVANVTQKLLQRGFIPRGYFGFAVQPVPIQEPLKDKLQIPNEGALIVLTVETGAPADQAGILPGDIVTGIGDTSVGQIEDLQKFSDSNAIGTRVRMTVVRGGELKSLELTVGERPRRRG
jgi:S1-C subfamily serine protease